MGGLGVTAKGPGVSLGGDNSVLKLMVVMVVYTKNHVNFISIKLL